MENVLQNPNVTLGDLLGGDLSYPNILSTISFPKIGKDNIQKFLDGGLLDENKHQSNMGFLKYFQYCIDELEINLNEVKVVVLSKFTSLLIYNKGDNFNTTYCGLKGKYNEYVTHLIEGINKIDILKIDIEDFLRFHIFEENKVFNTHTIKESDTHKDFEFEVMVDDVSIINYLLHILPQYLPSEVNLPSEVVGFINNDTDEISKKFNYILQMKSMEFLNNIKLDEISNNLIKGEMVS